MYNSVRLYPEAVEACNKAISEDPKLAQAYQTRGFAKSNLGMYEDAIADFSKAFDNASTDDARRKAQILALRAYTHMLSGNNKKSCEDATLALKLDPRNERASWLVTVVCT